MPASFSLKIVGMTLSLTIATVAALGCGPDPTPTSFPVSAQSPLVNTATSIPAPTTAEPTTQPTTEPEVSAAPVGSADPAQVIPPMHTLQDASVRCLGEYIESLESGAMFRTIIEALVECLTPEEIVRSRTYQPPGGGPPVQLDFVCNEAWYDSIEAMLQHFGRSVSDYIPKSDPVSSNISFVERAAEAGIVFEHVRDDAVINLGGGAAAGDYNGDGYLDIYVTNSVGPNSLYRNNGDGTFTDVAQAAGVADSDARGYGVGWADYDNDGDLDLFVASFGASKLFRNEGPTRGNVIFSDVTSQAGVGDPDAHHRTMGLAWGDYDSDGFLDLVVVRHVHEIDGKLPLDRAGLARASRPLALYHNRGDGTFENVTALLGESAVYPSPVKGAGFKPAFTDYDNDGDQDLYIINDFGAANYPNVLWRNDGIGESGDVTFTDVSKESGTDLAIFGMGMATGDYDNDGDMDWYITDIGASEFLENQGDGTFVNQTERTGTGRGAIPRNWFDDNSVGWGTVFDDFDNDGLLDLYVVAGQMDNDPCFNMLHQPNAVFVNNGNGTFTDVSASSGADDPGTGRGVAHGDFNNDGRTDLLVVNLGLADGSPGVARLFENVSTEPNHWLDVVTIGTTSNRSGVGAKITVTAGGISQMREVGASQSHMSHSVVPAHFGLGASDQVDFVLISWPSGKTQRLTDVQVDRTLIVTEP